MEQHHGIIRSQFPRDIYESKSPISDNNPLPLRVCVFKFFKINFNFSEKNSNLVSKMRKSLVPVWGYYRKTPVMFCLLIARALLYSLSGSQGFARRSAFPPILVHLRSSTWGRLRGPPQFGPLLWPHTWPSSRSRWDPKRKTLVTYHCTWFGYCSFVLCDFCRF